MKALTTSEIVALVIQSKKYDINSRLIKIEVPNKWNITYIEAIEYCNRDSYLYGYKGTCKYVNGHYDCETVFRYSKLKAKEKREVEELIRKII